MSSLCIITARGGSKRIPRKNIKEFCGKPIIAYSIEAALESGIFDEVMVSTEDEEIAAIAREYGAAVPFMRSVENSDDHADTEDVLLEVLQAYEAQGRVFDDACCIYPTAPFITPMKLQQMHRDLSSDADCASIFTATPFSFPPQRGVVKVGDYAVWWQPEYADARSQDLERIYHDAGQAYFFDVDAFKISHALVGEQTRLFVVPETEVQDIDNEEDWIMAEMKFRFLREGDGRG